MIMELPTWIPEDTIDRLTGAMLAAKLELRLQQWPNAKPLAKQCMYARGTGDVARGELFKRGIETYTLLPMVTYLDMLALSLADEQMPRLSEYKAMIGEVAKRLHDASDPNGTSPSKLQWIEEGIPTWAPGETEREATAALSRLVARRLADWPYGLGLDEQRAYTRAIAREAVELAAAESEATAAAFAPITDFLRVAARECSGEGMDERLGQYRRAAARLSARLLAAAGPGDDQ